MKDPDRIAAARSKAELARAQLMHTAHQLQSRLAPKTLARDAWEGAKSKGADLAEDAVDAVRKRPIAAGGVVAAIALFLAREPLMHLAGKLVGRTDEGEEVEEAEEAEEEEDEPARPARIQRTESVK